MDCHPHQHLWSGSGRSNGVSQREAGVSDMFFSGLELRGVRRKINVLVIFTIATLLLCLSFLVGSARPIYAGMSFEERLDYMSLWPGGRIPIVISSKFIIDGKIDTAIAAALYAWGVQTHAAIQFPYKTAADNRYLYILTPEEFKDRTKETAPSVCGSWGPQTQKVTYLWLTKPNCLNLWSVFHELGHTIGLGHEHLRPDRAGYMTIKACNPDFRENAPVGFFDYFSIMHSEPVLQNSTSRSSFPSPWNTPKTLSKGDIDTVRALYAFDIRPNSDIFGCDYADFPLFPESTQRDCQLACAADVRCTAYTYAAIGVLAGGNPDPHCYLKGNGRPIPGFTDRLNFHSGKRKKGQEGSFGAARHVDLVGGQISGGVVNMPNNVLKGKNCKELCWEDPKCQAYTFAPGWESGTCYKKSHNPPPGQPRFKYMRQRDYLSGVIPVNR
jgi:hypothetical protein